MSAVFTGTKELPLIPEEKLMKCESNRMDNTFDMEIVLEEQSKVYDAGEDVDVDVTLGTNPSGSGQLESECHDATDHSSSFGNTISGTEETSSMNDTEVESQLCCTDTSATVSVFNGYKDLFLPRKKRLTDHWRKFIRPLMWRCKWIELQVQEFKSQALKYDKELAEHDKVKQLTYESYMLEGLNAKTSPFSSQVKRKRVMKRKKRKRLEETVDLESYLSQHNLFSYYEKKRLADDAPLDDYCENTVNGKDTFGLDVEWPSLESWNDHSSTEPVLRKIDEIRFQIGKLKTRIEKVVSEHPVKFCSINKLISPVACDVPNSCDHKTTSPKNIQSRPESECKKEDLPMPESVCSSHGEVTPLPNMLDFTYQPHARSYDEMEEGEILIHNEEEEGLQSFERMGSQLLKKHEAAHKEEPLEGVEETPEAAANIGDGSKIAQALTTRTSTRKRKGKKPGFD